MFSLHLKLPYQSVFCGVTGAGGDEFCLTILLSPLSCLSPATGLALFSNHRKSTNEVNSGSFQCANTEYFIRPALFKVKPDEEMK